MPDTPILAHALTPILFSPAQLHGIYCAPAEEPRAQVLLVSPLFEEKRCAHRALITCARALARRGAGVLLPDLTGTGNSDGLLTEITLARWMDDLHAAAQALGTRAAGPLTVVGCRAGALLAAWAVTGMPAARLVLWQPVLTGKSYLRQCRTRRMIQDSITGEKPPVGPHEVEGQTLAAALYDELEQLDLPDVPPPLDIVLFQCAFTEKLAAEYERLLARWPRLRIRCLATEPFWNPHTPGEYRPLAEALAEEVEFGGS